MEEADATSSIIMSGDQNTRSLPPRASFLGIPAEMRLRIYDFLLDASRRPESDFGRGLVIYAWHCCWKEPAEGSAKCSCAKSVYPSILSVSKLINREAAPVLHATSELRIDTPQEMLLTGNAFVHSELWTLLQHYQHQALPITSLVFATSLRKIPIRIQGGESLADQLAPLWSRLCTSSLNIKIFRLYLRYDFSIDENFDFGELLGFLTLPNLERLNIEILFPDIDAEGVEVEDAWPFLHDLRGKAEYEIQKLGRDIEVRGVLRDETAFSE